MQSLDEPWTEEEGDGSEHPYYNSIPSKTPPPGGFVDVRLQPRPHAPDVAQVSHTPRLGLAPSAFPSVFFRRDTGWHPVRALAA